MNASKSLDALHYINKSNDQGCDGDDCGTEDDLTEPEPRR